MKRNKKSKQAQNEKTSMNCYLIRIELDKRSIQRKEEKRLVESTFFSYTHCEYRDCATVTMSVSAICE